MSKDPPNVVFERLRGRASFTPNEDDNGSKADKNSDGGRKEKAADILIRLATGVKELFHAPDGTGFAIILVGDHLETWPLRSKGFRRWLAREFFTETASAPNSDAIQSALNVIEARAHFDGRQRATHVRVGAFEGRMYLDLADAQWRAVEISSDGWRIIDQSPIVFRRAAGMLALPHPVHGGSINELRKFLNVKDDRDYILSVAFMLAALRERGPYPVLCLAGEHGSAKSTFTAVLRKLVDPNSAPLRALPRDDRDLFIAATNAHLLAFDNISHLPDWISDTLCRLATGGGFATRQLYSDQDEQLFDAMRPIILNGIEDIVGRPDLADRSLFLNLENITEDKRKAEKDFWAEFELDHQHILGVLLDGVSHGLKRLATTRLDAKPRMADFALWATACETAFWNAGTFAKAYGQNRADAVATVIEADLVATALQTFMAERRDLAEQSSLIAERDAWSGTSSSLLGALKMAVGQDQTKLKEWPATPRALSGRLRRAAATLRKVDIEITFDRKSGGTRTRMITIARTAGPGDRPNRPDRPASQDHKRLDCDDSRGGRGDDGLTVPAIGPPNSLKNNGWGSADDRDANTPTQTGTDPSTGVCAYCGSRGGNQVSYAGEGAIYLHRGCEDRWIERRMGEEGIG